MTIAELIARLEELPGTWWVEGTNSGSLYVLSSDDDPYRWTSTPKPDATERN